MFWIILSIVIVAALVLRIIDCFKKTTLDEKLREIQEDCKSYFD